MDNKDKLQLDCGCIIFKDGRKDMCKSHYQQQQLESWKGKVDRMSGAFDDYELDPNYHEMGH